MNFVKELQDLRIFASEHFPPARSVDDPCGPLHSSEFGPSIHQFRHRAEVFLLTSGYCDKDACEYHEIGLAMPDAVFNHLEKALLFWKLQQSQSHGLRKEEKKEKL